MQAFRDWLRDSCALTALQTSAQFAKPMVCSTYTKFSDLKTDYEAGQLHPGDLKEGLKTSLNAILEPVRKHFETDAGAKDLLKKVKQYRTTR